MSGLRIENVSHRFGDVVAVRDVTLSVAPGELVCLLGPSGCGKSTTLRLAAGLERLQTGRVLIAGREVASERRSLPPEERNVGLVFQDYALFPHLNVIDNVAFGLGGQGASARRRQAHEMLARVGLEAYAEAYPHTLSGGEQQRVALARALAPRPGLMLMDEPFSDLDIRLRDRIRDETLALLKEQGIATLLVTHDPEEAMRMADRIAIMRQGRVIQEGTPADLYTRPTNAFVAQFFSELNRLEGVVEMGHVETPVGRLCTPGFAEGASVTVLVRPEDVRLLDGAQAGAEATVQAARLLGAYSLVNLKLATNGTTLDSRIAAAAPPLPGARVRIAVNPEKTFVFARERSHIEDREDGGD